MSPQYLPDAPAKSGAGISLSAKITGDVVICRTHGYTSMVGRAGASQDAPVSCNAGKANSARFCHHEISLSGGG
ncbi:ash family protein [Leclercia sp. TB492]|uniref:ash family protein n=1 Tax=Leclercia sp. TB492 TaxID=3412682 RepID=UPI003CF5C4F1